MKKLILAFGLAALSVACRSSGANMSDSSSAGKDCTNCTKEQMENCPDCKGKADCKEGEQVCPVTGKSLN